MTLQIEEDLRLIKHTLIRTNVDWQKWCLSLPPLKDVHYTLVHRDGTIICDSVDKKMEGQKLVDLGEVEESFESRFASNLRRSSIFNTQAVFASMRLGDNLMIRKVIPVSSLRDNMDRFDRVLFLRIVPFALASYLVFIFLFYRSTKPLGVILSKVEKFKEDIPFNRSLALLYERDEWRQIEEALNKADQKLQTQVQEVKTENEKSTAILEAINDDIIAIDKFETILFYNSKFKNNFIQKREGQEINPKIWHIFADEVLSAFRSVLATGTPCSLKRINFPNARRPERYYDLTITPLRSSSETISGALGVLYDVTEFKLTEQMRVDFVANVSHEIRTPLTSIKGFTQILQSQSSKIDSNLHPFLDKIIFNTERMISLFNDLLNLSVIESKNFVRIEEFSLPQIVEGITSIGANYPDKKINIQTNLELEHFKGDPRLIEQVLINLTDNACKYADDEVNIVISSYEKDGLSYISVKDNGPGIAKEHLPRIFERFYRVDFSRESSRGTGLGLSIVKNIISKHKGKIWAHSEGPGTGTTFIIELPS